MMGAETSRLGSPRCRGTSCSCSFSDTTSACEANPLVRRRMSVDTQRNLKRIRSIEGVIAAWAHKQDVFYVTLSNYRVICVKGSEPRALVNHIKKFCTSAGQGHESGHGTGRSWLTLKPQVGTKVNDPNYGSRKSVRSLPSRRGSDSAKENTYPLNHLFTPDHSQNETQHQRFDLKSERDEFSPLDEDDIPSCFKVPFRLRCPELSTEDTVTWISTLSQPPMSPVTIHANVNSIGVYNSSGQTTPYSSSTSSFDTDEFLSPNVPDIFLTPATEPFQPSTQLTRSQSEIHFSPRTNEENMDYAMSPFLARRSSTSSTTSSDGGKSGRIIKIRRPGHNHDMTLSGADTLGGLPLVKSSPRVHRRSFEVLPPCTPLSLRQLRPLQPAPFETQSS